MAEESNKLSEFEAGQHNSNLDYYRPDSLLDVAELDTYQTSTRTTKPAPEISYTISEDLADGKLAQKDKDLKVLLKEPASRPGAVPPPGELSSASLGISPSMLAAYTHALGMSEALISPQHHSNKKRKIEITEADATPNAGRNDYTHSSQIFEKQYSDQIQTVYLIHCSNDLYDYHTALAYEDPPFREPVSNRRGRTKQQGDLAHLNGRNPITNLLSYMRTVNDNTAIVVFRHVKCSDNVLVGVDSNQDLIYTESLAIKSTVLRTAIAIVAKCYYNKLQDLDKTRTNAQLNQIEQFSISPAQLFMFHHLELLENYMNSHPEATQHIKVLLAYCDRKYGQDFAAATELFRKGLVSQSHLDKLFVPNHPILIKGGVSGDIDAAYMMYTWPRFSADGTMEIDCWCWQHDGKAFVRRNIVGHIKPISSPTVPIRTLPIYPLQFASDRTKKILEVRGQKHWSYRHSSHVAYKGWNISHDEFYPGSRFMIDYKVYRKMHENGPAFTFSRAPAPRTNDTWASELELDENPTPTDYLLMPAEIYGFYLTEKKWINIFVDGVEPIQWNKSAYERLVLPCATKELIRALVSVRTSQRGVKHGLGSMGKRIDIISGKGNGLIMLLHGAPGTGKSLTAESVAEIAEMPLYRVTCGDIGDTPAEVEKYLAAVMHLGTTWNCVLLLDEADVFLEERSTSDLSRNSIVSVFLRILEYYDGILILTSNRVGIFDEAFKSRIQVALHYQNLTRAGKKKIWTNFFEMLEEDEEDVNLHELRLRLDDLADFDLNGRQIRNTLTTARELAMFKNEPLDWKHLEQALKVSTDFSNYIQTMQGHTDDQKARDDKIR